MQVSLGPKILTSITTDVDGSFELEDIRPGSYTLLAYPTDGPEPMKAADGTNIALITTYYPSVTDPPLAEHIEVSSMGAFGEYEIRMQAAPVQRVRGIVLDEAGKPAPFADLYVFRDARSALEPVELPEAAIRHSFFAVGVRQPVGSLSEGWTKAGADGRFEFDAVPRGDWTIEAGSESNDRLGTTVLLVRQSDVDGLEIRLASRANLAVAIEWRGMGPGPSGFRLLSAVVLVREDGEFVDPGTNASGSLVFRNVLPGRYRMIVGSGFSGQVFLGDNDVTDRAFAITAAEPPARVVLKRESGGIKGAVEEGGATVVIIPQRTDRPGIGQTVVCASDGSFELSDVSPGDYFIAAFESAPSRADFGITQLPSAGMLSLMPTRGASVKVEEGSVARIRLSAISVAR